MVFPSSGRFHYLGLGKLYERAGKTQRRPKTTACPRGPSALIQLKSGVEKSSTRANARE
jgi:hypothetical protein